MGYAALGDKVGERVDVHVEGVWLSLLQYSVFTNGMTLNGEGQLSASTRTPSAKVYADNSHWYRVASIDIVGISVLGHKHRFTVTK